MVIIDLFSGAGGLTEGFLRTDAMFVAHVEKDSWACETLKTRILFHELKKIDQLELYWNYCIHSQGKHLDADRDTYIYKFLPELKRKIENSVLNLTFGDEKTPVEMIISKIRSNLNESGEKRVSVIIGGPPCQAYSLAGRGRMKEKAATDNRNYLFRYYKEIVDAFKPDLFIIENVPGILTAHNGAIIEAIKSEFLEIGYNFITGPESDDRKNIINASDFGVPQTRRRMLMAGFNKNPVENRHISPSRYFQLYNELNAQKVSRKINTSEAIGDLPSLRITEGNIYWNKEYADVIEYPILLEYQKLMRRDSRGIMNHHARFHNENDREIYRLVITAALTGKQPHYYDLPEHLKTHNNQASFTDRYKVHSENDIPHTIVAHISKDGHYNIHPDLNQSRSLTVREAARIQSFPDNYRFEGPRSAQYTQIGNAVPPILSECIAKAVKKIFYSKKAPDEHAMTP